MMNKKGFTLIELLAVIAIIALISLIAIPNIVGLSTGIKKDNMLDDAKKLISLAKYRVNKSYAIRSTKNYTFTFGELNENDDITTDPDGGSYVGSSSYVKYEVKNGTENYCIYLESSLRKICKKPDDCDDASCCTECVDQANLYSRSNVIDK